jgi:hypothetical protein
MATYSKVLLSGSPQGRPIPIGQVLSPGTILHTTEASASVIDEVTLFVVNTSITDQDVVVEVVGTTANQDLIIQKVPAHTGLMLLTAGLPITGTGGAGNTIRAFNNGGAPGALNIVGFVNRYTP